METLLTFSAVVPHYESPHAILGAVIYILLFFQVSVGFTQYFVPALYGGVGNAKSVVVSS